MKQRCLVVLTLFALGCGGGGEQSVSGTVKFEDGSPVPNGQITFASATENYRAQIGSDGSFTIKAPKGNYNVAVMANETSKAADGEHGAGGGVQESKPLVDTKFNDAAKSGLNYTVSGGASDVEFKVTKPAA